MCTGGYIKSFRSTSEWRWAKEPLTLALWMHILWHANYEDKDWMNMTIKRGQFVTTLDALVDMSGLTKSQARTRIQRLEKTGEIRTQKTNKFTIITICNYDVYQSDMELQNVGVDTQIAHKSHSNHTQIALTKEIKEIKKEKNIINSYVPQENCDTKQPESKSRVVMVKPTLEEVKAYVNEKQFSDVDPERFWCYYESQGWKVGKNPMKNWKMAVNTWHNKTTNYGSNNNISNDKRRGTYADATSAQEYSTSF